MSADLETRLVALEARLREVEDRQAIMQLIATYGPAADTCTQEAIAGLWSEDGIYAVAGLEDYVGAAVVGALVESDNHLDFVRRGCSHVMAMPHIMIDGDRAVATGYSQVFARDGQYWRVDRASANRWELVRTVDGWRVVARYNHLMDGSESSREVLREAVAPTR